MGGWGPIFTHLQDSMASLVEPSLVWGMRGLGQPLNPSPATLRASAVIGIGLLYVLLSFIITSLRWLEGRCRASPGKLRAHYHYHYSFVGPFILEPCLPQMAQSSVVEPRSGKFMASVMYHCPSVRPPILITACSHGSKGHCRVSECRSLTEGYKIDEADMR